jgi:hypothetical protein
MVYEKPARERGEVTLFIDWMKATFRNG